MPITDVRLKMSDNDGFIVSYYKQPYKKSKNTLDHNYPEHKEETFTAEEEQKAFGRFKELSRKNRKSHKQKMKGY